MPEYRFYTLLRGDKIAGPATQVECSSDEEAISQAKKFINGLDIEVWQGARLIARLQSPHNRNTGPCPRAALCAQKKPRRHGLTVEYSL